MQAATDLLKLRDAVFRRTLRLRQIVPRSSRDIGTEEKQAIAFVTIELDNLIVVGLRQYTKSCLLGCRTSAGGRVSASIQPASTEEAAAYIYKSLNPRGYINIGSPPSISEKKEHVFRNPRDVEKVLNDYSAANSTNIRIAVSLNAEVFSEAKICRNYFAHRAQNTFEGVRKFAASLGIVDTVLPEQLLLRGRPGNGVRFIDGWLADIENFFDLAV